MATLTGTQGQHEVLKAFQETIGVQLHPAVRVLPWPTASALGFPILKIEAQAGCTQADETLALGGRRGLKREGRLRNYASQGPGKTPREASPHRP